MRTRELQIVRLAGALHTIVDQLVADRVVRKKALRLCDRATRRLQSRSTEEIAPLLLALADEILRQKLRKE